MAHSGAHSLLECDIEGKMVNATARPKARQITGYTGALRLRGYAPSLSTGVPAHHARCGAVAWWGKNV